MNKKAPYLRRFFIQEFISQETEHVLFLHRKLHLQLQSHLAQPYLLRRYSG